MFSIFFKFFLLLKIENKAFFFLNITNKYLKKWIDISNFNVLEIVNIVLVLRPLYQHSNVGWRSNINDDKYSYLLIYSLRQQ